MKGPAPDPFTLAVVQRVLEGAVRPLAERLTALEAVVGEHGKQLARTHTGKYQPGRDYEAGEECTWHGSTWRAAVDAPPGAPPGDGWILIAQGRDLPREHHK